MLKGRKGPLKFPYLTTDERGVKTDHGTIYASFHTSKSGALTKKAWQPSTLYAEVDEETDDEDSGRRVATKTAHVESKAGDFFCIDLKWAAPQPKLLFPSKWQIDHKIAVHVYVDAEEEASGYKGERPCFVEAHRLIAILSHRAGQDRQSLHAAYGQLC